MQLPVTVEIVLLNFNGRELLRRHLPSVLKAAAHGPYPCGVTVVDNQSSDGSLDFLKREFPQVRLWQAPRNDVLCSYNEAAKALEAKVLILLNTDVAVEPDFIAPLVDVFLKHEDALFAATRTDLSTPVFRRGVLSARLIDDPAAIDRPGLTLNTGMAAFDREKFLELGGYDPLYLPGRYEDMDLCYRGWKRGWKGYYEPRGRIHHEGGSSFKAYFTEQAIQRLVLRNEMLFMVKNFTDPKRLLLFWIWSVLRFFAFLATGRWHMMAGYLDFFQRWPEARRAAQRVRHQFRLRDGEILRLFRQPEAAPLQKDP